MQQKSTSREVLLVLAKGILRSRCSLRDVRLAPRLSEPPTYCSADFVIIATKKHFVRSALVLAKGIEPPTY